MNWTVLWSKLKALEGKVDSLELISFETVTELPETGEPNIIYLVPKSDPETGNYSDEYIWDSDNQTFEKIGDTMVSPLPEVSAADNGKVLGVANGIWNKIALNLGVQNVIARVEWSSSQYALKDYTNQELKNFIGSRSKNVILYLIGSDEYYYYTGFQYIFQCAKVSHSQTVSTGSTITYRFLQLGTSKKGINWINDVNIPKIALVNNQSKSGKMLVSKYEGTIGEYILSDIPEGLPSVTSSDEGKVPEVNSSGEWAVATLSYAKDTAVAPLYDSTATYLENDIVTYNGGLYQANTDISTAEAWNSAHWNAITVLDIINDSITNVLNTSF